MLRHAPNDSINRYGEKVSAKCRLPQLKDSDILKSVRVRV